MKVDMAGCFCHDEKLQEQSLNKYILKRNQNKIQSFRNKYQLKQEVTLI